MWQHFPNQENPFLELFRNEPRSLRALFLLNSGAVSIPQFLAPELLFPYLGADGSFAGCAYTLGNILCDPRLMATSMNAAELQISRLTIGAGPQISLIGNNSTLQSGLI